MCGITGYFGQGNREILEKMTKSLSHRGPDDQGFYLDSEVGLGHRRLSIIDLSSAGHQPMANEEQTICLIFNGEIYNYRDLKTSLNGRHRFKSLTDTEVLIHLYEETGENFLEKVNGMFALALYDKNKKKLILARDRLGKKPLYWGIFNNTLIFGSELKSLILHPLCKRELDLRSLNKYLIYEYVPTPHSIFKNIQKLEPGHILTFNGKEVGKKQFWDIKFSVDKKQSEKEILTKLNKEMDRAVKIRLESDVPLGIFLSGGIDSTAIAYYAQKNSIQKIKTFSIGFEDKSFDESNYARTAAEFLQTDHYEQILTPQASLDLIPQLADLLDEPLADGSIVPTYLLSKFTKGRVTVALGGDGGDELFCGYDPFVAHQIAEFYKKIPKFLRRGFIEKLANILPVSFNNISLDFKIKKFIEGFNNNESRIFRGGTEHRGKARDKLYRNQIWLGSFGRDERSKLFTKEVWNDLEKENEFEEIDNYLNSLKDNNFYHQLIYIYLKTYLMDDILVKVDRASMYNSLEVRAPFLDFQLVDFVNTIPANLKLKGLKTKYILKKLMEDKIPKEIVYRKKKGFGMPIAKWLENELKPFCLDLLSKERINNQGIFNYCFIEKLLKDHFDHKKDNRKLIWTLLVFQMWQDKWLK
jgi:asparagine synthase (glutamine-hydrolysing)